MAYPVNLLITDVLTIVGATWTDVMPGGGGGGIHRYDDAVRVSWEEKTFPFAIWQMPPWQPADWGIANVAWEPEFEVHYLMQIPALIADGLAQVETRLMALRAAMFAGAFTASSATILPDVTIDTSGSHPANEVFYTKNAHFVGGMIGFQFSVGETAV